MISKRADTKGISKHPFKKNRFKTHHLPIYQKGQTKPRYFFPINTVDLYIFHNKEKRCKDLNRKSFSDESKQSIKQSIKQSDIKSTKHRPPKTRSRFPTFSSASSPLFFLQYKPKSTKIMHQTKLRNSDSPIDQSKQ